VDELALFVLALLTAQRTQLRRRHHRRCIRCGGLVIVAGVGCELWWLVVVVGSAKERWWVCVCVYDREV
jgi:hypothetical protein